MTHTGSTSRPYTLPLLPWFPSAFAGSTRGWPLIAKGGYRELLDANWDQGWIPVEPNELRQLVGASKREWNIIWAKCEEKFPVIEIGNGKKVRMNLRLEEHRQCSIEKVEKLAANGRRGGQASARARGVQVSATSAQPIPAAIATANVNQPSTSTSTSGVSEEESPDLVGTRKSQAQKLDLNTPLTLPLREVINAANPNCHAETVWAKYKRYCHQKGIPPRNIENHLRHFAASEMFNERQYNSRKEANRVADAQALSQLKGRVNGQRIIS